MGAVSRKEEPEKRSAVQLHSAHWGPEPGLGKWSFGGKGARWELGVREQTQVQAPRVRLGAEGERNPRGQ